MFQISLASFTVHTNGTSGGFIEALRQQVNKTDLSKGALCAAIKSRFSK
jgi:hypothetical protein